MRIGVDARELCGKPTGVGRHLAGLLGAWSGSAAASRHTFVLYSHEAIPAALTGAECRVLPFPPGTAWEQVALPAAARKDALDVFFSPGYTAPLRLTIPTIVVVHDISFVAHPEWFRWKEGLRRRALTRWSCHRANLVLTVSDASRREIMSHFSLGDARVRRIYPGVTTPGSLAAGPAGREPMALFVGSVFNRRHLPDLIRAFKPIARTHPGARLEIVGDNRTYPFEDLPALAESEGVDRAVAIRSYLPDVDLAALYSRSLVIAI